MCLGSRQRGAGLGKLCRTLQELPAHPWLPTFLLVLPTNDVQTDVKASAVPCCCPPIYQFHHLDRKMCSAKAAPYLCWLQKPQCISLRFLGIDFQSHRAVLQYPDGILQISKHAAHLSSNGKKMSWLTSAFLTSVVGRLVPNFGNCGYIWD